ncbi:hypothetical protein MKW94_025106 [Papaver nudicaule]|uniref:Uncharacterized protein n=1 Tax=Papaver nudicaule TaxID=74823 RepID=A0AA41VTG0_PAPNU|nr:hypothetical protein [Papaver nudicaule]
MFNNAGVSGANGSITTADMDAIKDIMAVNICGIIHGIKHAAKAMIKSAIMGGLASHGYTLTKEAMLGLARSTACELGVHGIRVNCISPHGVPSEMLVTGYRKILRNAKIGLKDVDKIISESGSLLPGRCGTMEDIAQAAIFLASDDAGYITGHNLVVDGGFTSAYSTLSFIYQ